MHGCRRCLEKELLLPSMARTKASLTSDILLSKLGMARNVLIKKFSKNQYAQLSKVRSEKFDAFSRKQFRLSPKYNSKAELGNKCKDNYSSVLVGSDQLWLPGNIAADYYTLNFVPETVNTIAYATSFGQSSIPKMLSVFLEVRPISAFCRGKIGNLLQSRRVLRSIPCPLRSRTGC